MNWKSSSIEKIRQRNKRGHNRSTLIEELLMTHYMSFGPIFSCAPNK